jgi:hypothetical protein
MKESQSIVPQIRIRQRERKSVQGFTWTRIRWKRVTDFDRDLCISVGNPKNGLFAKVGVGDVVVTATSFEIIIKVSNACNDYRCAWRG